jgi:nitrate/nitrite-specific signal transduction histidine kinase
MEAGTSPLLLDAVSDKQLQKTNERLTTLHEISRRLSEKKPLTQLLTDIMETSKRVMEAEASSLLLYDPEKNHLYFDISTGEKGDQLEKGTIELGSWHSRWVVFSSAEWKRLSRRKPSN